MFGCIAKVCTSEKFEPRFFCFFCRRSDSTNAMSCECDFVDADGILSG